jgi:hypothetical protein
MGNCDGAYFQYETTRSGEVAFEMLGSFKSCIINDGFSGYNRFKKSKKIHEELFKLLLKLERDSLPRSGLGKAVAYTLNLWEGLSKLLADPYTPMTNNMVERVLRNPVK